MQSFPQEQRKTYALFKKAYKLPLQNVVSNPKSKTKLLLHKISEVFFPNDWHVFPFLFQKLIT